ncbi:RNA polymerase sigma factor [Candidatus Laterigemmans baculatus]|uniref:RNA polymerase sigma factor n=1 Tax=Candidatus Laterigemmans baculatus TaxID=2770505 RepID=UPI0013D9542A|nr:sigma-70 family RNA polymerase sigma factor [Candidatus Laterigemmans baculatus]
MDHPHLPTPPPPEHPTLSSTLLGDVQQMDAAAWSRLVEIFGPIVYRWCRTTGVPAADAADVVQEVFTSVARGIGTFRRQKEEGSFRSWLATITRNRVRDYFRRQAARESVRDAAVGGTEALRRLEQHPDSLESTICPESAAGSILRHSLEAVQAEFTPTTWKAFWMAAVEGKPAAEIAETTGLSLASVYQAKSRVLKRLRGRLAEVP